MQIKVARILASCACVLGLVLSLSAVTVQAQTAAPAATQAAPAAVSAAVTAPAPAVEAKKAADATDNPYGIEALWKTSDAVAKTVLLLLLVFYHGKVVLGESDGLGWPTLFSVVLTFGGFAVYDALMSGSIFSDQKTKNIAAFVLVALVIFIMTNAAGFGHRSLNIHVGAMFGTTMAFNVWFRIWPSQQQIISAIKNGAAPDAKLVALAGLRSRHNTYLSIPLVWTMLNSHTQAAFHGFIPEPIALMIVILFGWHLATRLYGLAGKADRVKSGL